MLVWLQTPMEIPLSITYGFVLIGVLLLAKWLPGKYVETSNQQLNVMVVFHALVVPVLALVYYLQFDFEPLYANSFDAVMRTFFGMTIAYSVVSTGYYLLFFERKDNHIIFHHLATILLFTYVVFGFKELPGYWGMIVITQFNPFFYHTYLILKETPSVKPERLQFWYNLNYYMWIVLRIILLGGWIILGIYGELTLGSLDTIGLLIAAGFVGLTLYFSVVWLLIMVRNRRAMPEG